MSSTVIREIIPGIPDTEPLITDVMADGFLFSMCIFRKKIYSFYKTGIFVEGSDESPDVEGEWNSLYFILIHLQRIGDEQSVRELCPFIDEYDLTKFIHNLEYSVLHTYLEIVPAKEIPVTALQAPLLTHLFDDVSWTLPSGTVP